MRLQERLVGLIWTKTAKAPDPPSQLPGSSKALHIHLLYTYYYIPVLLYALLLLLLFSIMLLYYIPITVSYYMQYTISYRPGSEGGTMFVPRVRTQNLPPLPHGVTPSHARQSTSSPTWWPFRVL